MLTRLDTNSLKYLKFTKDQVTRSIGADPVVHIASHFKLRPGNNLRSYLVLGENKTLTMAEVYDDNMDFSGADLQGF